MRPRSNGHIVVGGACAALGAALLASGASAPGFLRREFLDTPMPLLALTAGLVLTLAGVLILIFSFRRPEELAPTVPAHVAFNSRMTIPDIIPTRSPKPAAASAARAAAPMAPSSARLPAPEPTPQRRVAPVKDDMAHVDTEIRELTRKINKAGVMLATGQLSQQGYLAYVEDLKRQRGKLEVVRVRHELRSS